MKRRHHWSCDQPADLVPAELAVAVMTVTTRDKYECARRELALRNRFYPRWVVERKMTGADADRQIELMEAIAEDYRIQAEREEAQERLL